MDKKCIILQQNGLMESHVYGEEISKFDGYLTDGYKKCKCITGTYLCKYNDTTMVIRYPGATRGYVKHDNNNVITEVVIYDDSYEDKEEYTNVGCYDSKYRKEINELCNSLIGRKLIFANLVNLDD